MNAADALPVIWFFIIGFGVLMYVLLDGFVLGIGILAPFAEDDAQCDLMMNTAAPIWDGNETWLVLGGAGLFAAFPKAYAAVLSALYLPVLLMLIALVFRGVAFEFRFKAHRSRRFWGTAFAAGSVLTAFAQGVILGALVQGLPLDTQARYTGDAFGWFSPFSMLTGIALVTGYGLLGATWLVLKTDGRVQRIAFDLARPLMLATVAAMGLVSAWLPFIDSLRMQRWFGWPNVLYLSPVPVATVLAALMLWRAVRAGYELQPFLWSLALFVLGFIGLVAGMWPNLVPPRLTIWEAAATPSSQTFTLVGAAIMLPAVLFYTAYSYRVFRGKVTGETGYHD